MKYTHKSEQLNATDSRHFVIRMAIKKMTRVCHYHTNVLISRIDSKCSLDMSEVKKSLVKSSSTISSAAGDPEKEDGE